MFLLPSVLAFFLLQAPAKATLPGAINVTRVDAVLMCGGATKDDAFPALKREGFVSVINLRGADESGVDVPASRAAAEAAGLKYLHVPVRAPLPEQASVDAFLKAVTNTANQPMYIHCGSANRVAALWLIKRVVVDGWEVARASDEAALIGLTSEPLRKFAIEYATTHKK
jgi:uncharacterized protein (TIGR01244 family)